MQYNRLPQQQLRLERECNGCGGVAADCYAMMSDDDDDE